MPIVHSRKNDVLASSSDSASDQSIIINEFENYFAEDFDNIQAAIQRGSCGIKKAADKDFARDLVRNCPDERLNEFLQVVDAQPANEFVDELKYLILIASHVKALCDTNKLDVNKILSNDILNADVFNPDPEFSKELLSKVDFVDLINKTPVNLRSKFIQKLCNIDSELSSRLSAYAEELTKNEVSPMFFSRSMAAAAAEAPVPATPANSASVLNKSM